MREVLPEDLENKFVELGEAELFTAFKAIVGCNGESIDLSIDEETYGKDRFALQKQIITDKKDIVIKVTRSFKIDYHPLFVSLGIEEKIIPIPFLDLKAKKILGFYRTNGGLNLEYNNVDIITVGEEFLKNPKDFILECLYVVAKNNNGTSIGLEERFEEIWAIKYSKDSLLYEFTMEDISYIIGLENIIKRTCKELGLTYSQLAEQIGYGEGALKTSVSTGKISNSMRKAIELYKKVLELENKLAESEKIKATLKEWLI